LTSPEPGTTIASFTFLRHALATHHRSAARMSSIRELVHEPMKTLSIAMSVIALLGSRPM
jgi:hypothetical protein